MYLRLSGSRDNTMKQRWLKRIIMTKIINSVSFLQLTGICRVISFLLIISMIIVGCGGAGDNDNSSNAGTNAAALSANQGDDNSLSDNDTSENDNSNSVSEDNLEKSNAAAASNAPALYQESDWVTFLLLCNEGMNNTGSNVGNTLMAVSMNPETGKIRLMMLTWDTFVNYEGYDIPQLIDMAYRNGGPEEAVKVFDGNFETHIDRFMSLNFLNLATLIDDYGGVKIDVTRAERNAINGMVASKRRDLQARAGENLISQHVMDMLEQEYHLTEFGPETQLNGLQAVSYGWLQYDSVYNCCERDIEVVAALFQKVSEKINEEAVFYTEKGGLPDKNDHRRFINLDNITDQDREFLIEILSPITNTSFNNLTKEEFSDMALTFARSAYLASREGVDIFDNLENAIFPLEAEDSYDIVAGIEGHLIDYDKNSKEMKNFLYNDTN